MALIRDILFLFYPPKCEVCGRLLAPTEKICCVFCLFRLPRTNFHMYDENPVAMLFWGRVKVSKAASWFYFYKGSPYQELLHKLKYKGQKEIGLLLGRFMATELKNSAFAGAGVIVPVPLHPKKKKKRGYNQSELIADGIAEVFGISTDYHSLRRLSDTSTQTKKNRFDRFLNMSGKFEVVSDQKIRGQSVLLIDDVVTTGSTLESCATVLLEKGAKEVMILTLAVA